MSSQLGKMEILQLFKSNVLKFFDSIIEMFPDESDLIVYRILFESQIPIDDSLRLFASRILPVQQMIKDRNDKFFFDNPTLFTSSQNSDKIIKWKHMWQSKNLNNNDRNMIWKWIDLFVALAQKYDSCEHKLQSLQ